jgi:hypothetical protein
LIRNKDEDAEFPESKVKLEKGIYGADLVCRDLP